MMPESAPALLRPLNVAAMLRSDPPELQMLVPGLIPAKKMGIFAAPAGFGKSYLALNWLLKLAARGHRVGLCELEDDPDELHRRLASMRDGFSATELGRIETFFKVYVPNPESGSITKLPEHFPLMAEAFRGCELVVLDTLNRLAGAGDENAAGPMGALMLGADAVSRAIDGTVLLLHHVGKGSSEVNGKPLLARLHQDVVRGSSAIGGAARFIIAGSFLTPEDAEQAGLDPDAAQAGNLGALALAKCSSLPARKTMLYCRAPNGLLVPLEGGAEALHRLASKAEKAEGRELGIPRRALKTLRTIVEEGDEAVLTPDPPPELRAKVTNIFWGKHHDKNAALRNFRSSLRKAGLIDENGQLTQKGKSVANTEDAA